MRLARDNFFRVVSLNLYFMFWANLIKSNVFHNHKCNIGPIINHKY